MSQSVFLTYHGDSSWHKIRAIPTCHSCSPCGDSSCNEFLTSTLGGAKLALAAAENAFKAANREDHLKIMVAAGVGHAVSPEQHKAALDWLEKWLR